MVVLCSLAVAQEITPVTLFWVSKNDSLAGEVGRADKNTADAGVDGGNARHPNPNLVNQWIGNKDGSALTLAEGQQVNLFLKNADVDTNGDFILTDENKQELVHVSVVATSGADTFVSSRHYSLKGKIVKIAASVACDKTERTSGDFDGPICLNLPLLQKDVAGDAIPVSWSALGCWGGQINGQCGAATTITIGPGNR
jgi:hypothetical protein